MRSLSEIRKVIRFCQKNGILRYKDGDFEVELKSLGAVKPGPEISGAAQSEFPSWDSLSTEQKLLWSSTPEIGQS